MPVWASCRQRVESFLIASALEGFHDLAAVHSITTLLFHFLPLLSFPYAPDIPYCYYDHFHSQSSIPDSPQYSHSHPLYPPNPFETPFALSRRPTKRQTELYMMTFSHTHVPLFTKLLCILSQTLDHIGAVVVFPTDGLYALSVHDDTLSHFVFFISYQHFLQGGRRAYNYGLAVCLYLMITARIALLIHFLAA